MRGINGLPAVLGLGEFSVALPHGKPACTSEVAEVTSAETPTATLRPSDGYGKLPLDIFMPLAQIYSYTLPYVAILLVAVLLINCQPWFTFGSGEWREQ